MQESLINADSLLTFLAKSVTSLLGRLTGYLKSDNLPVFALNWSSGEDDTMGIKTMKACQEAENKYNLCSTR